jgi:hypothetical protein
MFTESEQYEIEVIKGKAQKKLRELLADLPTESYPYFKEMILTGGCFASLFQGESPKDWDVYLRDIDTAQSFDGMVMGDVSMMALVKDVNPAYRVATKVRSKVITENAVTFKNQLQVITNNDKTGRLTFDFIHCMPYFDMSTQKMFISRAQYDCIKRKKLVKNPAHTRPLGEHRVEKFISRGWTIGA